MPKYYKARVKLEKTVEFSIAADNDENALKRAKSQAPGKQGTTSYNIASVDLTFERECKFNIGQTIKHPFFGKGKILELSQMTNMADEITDCAKIKFEDGSTKEIAIGQIADLEILD